MRNLIVLIGLFIVLGVVLLALITAGHIGVVETILMTIVIGLLGELRAWRNGK